MEPNTQLKINDKYLIEVTFYKKMLKFNLPDTSVESLIAFLRKANKVNETESVYLYLQPTNKLINRLSKLSQIFKEIQDAYAKMPVVKTGETQNGEAGSPSIDKNVVRIRMEAYETFWHSKIPTEEIDVLYFLFWYLAYFAMSEI